MKASRDLKCAVACGSRLRPTTSDIWAASPSQDAGRVGSQSLAECVSRLLMVDVSLSQYGERLRVKRAVRGMQQMWVRATTRHGHRGAFLALAYRWQDARCDMRDARIADGRRAFEHSARFTTQLRRTRSLAGSFRLLRYWTSAISCWSADKSWMACM